jgi:hypothetical protein
LKNKNKVVYLSVFRIVPVVVFTIFLAIPVSAQEGRLEVIRQAVVEGTNSIMEWGTTKIEVSETRIDYPKMNEKELLKAITEAKLAMQKDFANDPELEQQMAAVEHNVRFKCGNHVTSHRNFTVWLSGGKWRGDQTILDREDSVQVPDALRDNKHIVFFPIDINRNRVVAFDGTSSRRTIFEHQNPNSRSLTIDKDKAILGDIRVVKELGHLDIASLRGDVKIISDRPDEIVIHVTNGPSSMKIALAPQCNFSVIRSESDVLVDGSGSHFVTVYDKYHKFGNIWYPLHREEQMDVTIEGERRPQRLVKWDVTYANFKEDIGDEKALFEPTLKGDYALEDNTISPPIRLRTSNMPLDSQVDVAIKATVAALETSHGNPSTNQSTKTITSTSSRPDHEYSQRPPEPVVQRNTTKIISFIIFILGGCLVLSGCVLLYKRKKG